MGLVPEPVPILSEKKLCYNIWYLHAFRGERDHFWPLVLFSKNILQLDSILEGRQLGWERLMWP